jgi:hypothetical protein
VEVSHGKESAFMKKRLMLTLCLVGFFMVFLIGCTKTTEKSDEPYKPSYFVPKDPPPAQYSLEAGIQVKEKIAHILIHGKGYAIVSALRSTLGDELFKKVYLRCVEEYKGKRMNYHDLRKITEEESGKNLLSTGKALSKTNPGMPHHFYISSNSSFIWHIYFI